MQTQNAEIYNNIQQKYALLLSLFFVIEAIGALAIESQRPLVYFKIKQITDRILNGEQSWVTKFINTATF